jgi:hypothetical protein
MHFSSTQVITVKKLDNSVNFTAEGIINHRAHNSLCKDKAKHCVTSYVMVYNAMGYVMLPRMCELYLAPTLTKLTN